MKDLFAGPTKRQWGYPFLEMAPNPHHYMNCADGVRIFQRGYFSILLRISPSLTSRARAILRQVKMLGIRLWLSMKLIAGRVTPASSANFSWERPFSFRKVSNSPASFLTVSSDKRSLIIRDHCEPLFNVIRNNCYTRRLYG